MKKMNEGKLELLLSQYIDGELSESEIKNVERLMAEDALIHKKVEELKNLKSLLSSKQKLAADIGFWTRFTVRLEDQKKEESGFLPFPRKFMPAVAFLSMLAVALVGTLVIQNRIQFVQFFSEKSQAVKDVYEKNLLQSSLLPLFSKVNKDKALQFSLFGTLALDDKSETSLRVDEQSEKGYRIEVGKDSKKKIKPVTFDRFLAEVGPTNEQRMIIDSLLELTGRRIESSVLIGDNNTMAIAPDLPPLNKIMVTNIASCLEPHQRIRFERLLEDNDAPYSVISQDVPKSKRRDLVLQSIQRIPHDDRFVIISPDTMMYSRIHINLDSIRQTMEEDMMALQHRREAILRKMLAREFQHPQRNIELAKPINPLGNEGFISVEISSPNVEFENQPMQVIVQPRIRKQIIIQGNSSHPVQVRVWKDTSSNSIAP
jgi:hypothetical protein